MRQKELGVISITQLKSATALEQYFDRELNAHAYYSKESQALAGKWQGQLSAGLGLLGEVTREEFAALAENKQPKKEESLTQRTRANRTIGYDITFKAPKGISIISELLDDDGVRAAFDEASFEAMQRIESSICTRVRVDQKYEDRETGNLAWGEFTHFTARPVDGYPDPHLHKHAVVFNVTRDPTEDRLKAAKFRNTIAKMPQFESEFHGNLARKLTALGYPVLFHGKYCDIDVPQSIRSRFSRREEQVLKASEERNINTGAGRAKIAALTRSRKAPNYSLLELRTHWRSRVTDAEFQTLRTLKTSQKLSLSQYPAASVAKAADFAVNHEFERSSAVPTSSLVATALSVDPLRHDAVSLEREIHRRNDLVFRDINGREFVTTKQAAAEEKQIIDFYRSGRSTCRSLSNAAKKVPDLSKRQQNALDHMLTSRDRVIAIEGKAGSGKTTLLKSVLGQIQDLTKDKEPIVFLAPTADASRGVLASEGFKNADTVARFIQDKEFQATAHKRIIVLDEAGLLSVSRMQSLFDIAKKQKARIVLVGDTGQHGPIERGNALAILKKHAGLTPATITENFRQTSSKYKEAINLLAQGEATLGLRTLEKAGCIREPGRNFANLIASRRAALKANKRVLVVSPTHREAKAVTKALREDLVASGDLGDKSMVFDVLKPEHATDAQKKLSSFYQRGQVLSFHRRSSGFKSGDRATIIGSGLGWIVAYDPQRLRLALIFNDNKKVRSAYSVNHSERIELRQGDLVRFTAHTKSTAPLPHLQKLLGKRPSPTRINSGTVHKVTVIKGHQILLANGSVVDGSLGTFTHGYVSTSYAAQGRTADTVLVAQSKASGQAAFSNQFYVTASRGRQSIEIFTDSIAALYRQAKLKKPELSAYGLMARKISTMQKDGQEL